MEYRTIWPDGSIHWIASYAEFIEASELDTGMFYGIAQDITERKRSEEALLQSEERFRTLADAVPQVIWTNEASGKANYFNQRWFDYSGLSYAESAGPGWQAMVHPDDAPASVERWQHALATGTVFDTEYRLRRHDGAYRWFIGRNVPLREDKYDVSGWFGSATDIHDLKEAEAAVRQSEERFRAIVGQATAGVAEMDVTGKFTLLNQRFCELTGYSEAALLGRPMQEIIYPDDLPECLALFEQAVQHGTSFAHEKRYMRGDGTPVWVSDSVSVIFDSEGKTQSVIAVVIDITERKQAEAALQRINEELEARVQERTAELQRLMKIRQELLRQLVSAQEEERRRISRELHDQMGQSLSALRLGLSTLAATPNDAITQLQAIAAQIDADVDRLALELRPSVLDGVGLVAAVEQHIAEWSQRQQIATDFQVVGSTSNRLAPEIEVVLYRVAQEALTNILKHAAATQVSVILEQRQDQVGLVIEDNGRGFDTDVMQARTANDRRLGLLGMQERVTQVGGTLTIESAPGEGATLYVRVPLPLTSEVENGKDSHSAG